MIQRPPKPGELLVPVRLTGGPHASPQILWVSSTATGLLVPYRADARDLGLADAIGVTSLDKPIPASAPALWTPRWFSIYVLHPKFKGHQASARPATFDLGRSLLPAGA